MNKIKRLICAILTIFVLLIGGYSMADELVTPEDLMDYIGISTDAYDSETLAELIKRFSVTKESIDGAPKDELAEALQQILSTDYSNNYAYLFDGPIVQLQMSDLSIGQIQHIAVFTTAELVYETALIDFSADKLYTDCSNYFLQDITTAEQQIELDPNLKESILDLIKKTNWLDRDTSGEKESGIGNSKFGIAIETSEGLFHIVFDGNEHSQWTAIHDIIVMCVGDGYNVF